MERIFKRPGGLPLPEDKRKGRPTSEGQCLNTLSQDTVTLPSMFNFLFNMTGISLSGLIAFFIMFSINRFVTLIVFLPLALLFVVLNLLRKKVETPRREGSQVGGRGQFHAERHVQLHPNR